MISEEFPKVQRDWITLRINNLVYQLEHNAMLPTKSREIFQAELDLLIQQRNQHDITEESVDNG